MMSHTDLSFSYDELPPEMKELIAKEITHLKDFYALRQASRAWNKAASASSAFGLHSFFQAHYMPFPRSVEFIRSPESLTLRCVRKGNYLANVGMHRLLTEDFAHGERMLFTAAFMTGCPAAMQILNMYFDLPGRTKFYYFSPELIQKYKDQQLLTLTEAYKKLFPAEKWDDCDFSLKSTICVAENLLDVFVNLYKDYYREHQGMSALNYQDAYTKFANLARERRTVLRLSPELNGRQSPTPEFLSEFNPIEFFNFTSTRIDDEKYENESLFSAAGEKAFFSAMINPAQTQRLKDSFLTTLSKIRPKS